MVSKQGLIYSSTDSGSSWSTLDEEIDARDISIGANDDIWKIASDNLPYKRNGNAWT